ncbi:MAG: DNA-3-methyladenine glycosylase [Candidatus Dormibacterales bacterium]
MTAPAPSRDSEPPAGAVLTPAFFDRDPLEVAPDLLGKVLVRRVGGRPLWGRLVEVEAYKGPEDLAAHSARGRTPRTEVMFGPPGRAYVYFVYGMHHCLNFVCRPAGVPQAILVRALEPGGDLSRASGPGLVCRALEVDRGLNGALLAPPHLYLVDDGRRPGPVVTGPRVGVGYSGKWAALPWRFCLDSPYVSRPWPPRASRRSR